MQTHSSRNGIIWFRTLAHAAGLSKDTWRESCHFASHAYLLSNRFHQDSGNDRAVFPTDRNIAMIPVTGSPDSGVPSPDLPDPSPQAPDPKGEPHNEALLPPAESCLRCGGLLIPDYTTSTERDERDKPVMLRRCVNCGSCMDLDILANRSKRPKPIRPRTIRPRPPTGPPRRKGQR